MERVLETQNMDALAQAEYMLENDLDKVWCCVDAYTAYAPAYIKAIDALGKRLQEVRKLLCNL